MGWINKDGVDRPKFQFGGEDVGGYQPLFDMQQDLRGEFQAPKVSPSEEEANTNLDNLATNSVEKEIKEEVKVDDAQKKTNAEETKVDPLQEILLKHSRGSSSELMRAQDRVQNIIDSRKRR